MKEVSTLLAVILILAVPVLADINQKANLNGDNIIEVDIKQTAWNYGSGDIYQDISTHVTGNYQKLSQDSTVLISGSDHGFDINNTMKGMNLIVIDLEQYGNNSGSGNINQHIDVLVDSNVQILDQDITVLIEGEE